MADRSANATLSGPQSGVTEAGSQQRKTLRSMLLAIGVALVVLVGLIVYAFSSGQPQAGDAQKPLAEPAGQLKEAPQDGKLGSNTAP